MHSSTKMCGGCRPHTPARGACPSDSPKIRQTSELRSKVCPILWKEIGGQFES